MEETVEAEIERNRKELAEIGQKLWDKPELCFEEKYAHQLLTDFLEKKGFSVERSYKIPTAFRAEFSSGGDSDVTVCIMCEYDALPEIGHACGHNLIAESSVGAALGIKKALQTGVVRGRLIVLGTPAEEGGGGKIILMRAGALKGIHLAVMAHPSHEDILETSVLANTRVRVRYTGVEAHASSAPWNGVNALDAAVAAYSNMSLLRQQMRPTWRVHGVFTDGGSKPNIIPSHAALYFYLRTPNSGELEQLKAGATRCFEAAAIATGTEVQMEWDENSYEPLLFNEPLLQEYGKHATRLGVHFVTPVGFGGSTDMGNVSQVVPSIHPKFGIPARVAAHTKGFAEAAGSPEAQPATLRAAKCLALTSTRFLADKEFRRSTEKAFKEAKEHESILTNI